MPLKAKHLVVVGLAIAGAAVIAVGFEKQSEMHTKAFAFETLEQGAKVRDYFAKNGRLPATLQEAGIEPVYAIKIDPGNESPDAASMRREISLRDGTIVATYTGTNAPDGSTLVLRFMPDGNGALSMDCTGGTLPRKLRVPPCIAATGG